MNGLLQDVRYAARQLRKNPGFTAVAMMTLALGIGANTAIFTVFNQVLLSKLPVHKPEELVLLSEHSKAETGSLSTRGWDEDLTLTYPGYKELRDRNHVFSGLAAVDFESATLVTADDTNRVELGMVTGNYFSVLTVQPILGRVLVPSDDIEHAGNPVIVLSDEYWHSHFGSDPAVLNRVVHINGQALTIVGVAQHRGFMDKHPSDVFIPLSVEQAINTDRYDRLVDPLFRWLVVFGRLSPGMTRSRALSELNPIWLDWRREVLNTMSHHIPVQQRTVWLDSRLDLRNGDRGLTLLESSIGGLLKVLEMMTLVVLLIACANVANLLLVRMVNRASELAVRCALGASRIRVLSQVVTEGLLLGLGGAAIGLFVGWTSLRLGLKVIPESNPLRSALMGRMDWTSLLFCAGLGVFTSVLFSVAPALVSTRVNLIRALHAQSGAMASNSGLRNSLVSVEIALSMTLLVPAAVFGWTLYQMRIIDPGFTPTRLLTFNVDAPALGKNEAEVRNEYQSITDSIRRLSGVRSVSFSRAGLLGGEHSWGKITVNGYPNGENEPGTFQDWVSPEFFSTTQIPLLAGREFTDDDRIGAQPVAVVDEAFVKHYYGGNIQAALAGSFAFAKGESSRSFGAATGIEIQIVGVIPVVRATRLDSSPSKPFFYLPYDQTYPADSTQPAQWHQANFYVRTTGNADSLPNTIRSLVHEVDPSLPVTGLETMDERISDTLFETRLMTALAISIGALALALAAIGLYGVLSFSVAQRTREIGVRIALGASREHISLTVTRRVGYLVVAGMTAGTALGWLAVHVLRTEIPNLKYGPTWLFAGTALGLATVMLLAGYLPARRAAKVDPMVALRYE
jgi:putative ABC transport system permease protein